ncbi:Methyltransferase type 12 [Tolumonas auensis DSM 9187]|uniref:Methyltransferase type 12 n=2 Tax=Tolumonas TaxID=43947 RepID=C4LF39_TOLAT|nr:Methyltransferase type 12 [Tolumonas auensis DSM 9187]
MPVSYYNQNAQSFYDGTLSVDMSSLFLCFEPYLSVRGRVLDAGCGSGRDSRYFLDQGFDVFAFDASAELASLLIYRPVSVCQFDKYSLETTFDGIWACASLLHVPKDKLSQVFCHLSSLLKRDGLFYCSFKYGADEVERDGRVFSSFTETGLEKISARLSLRIREIW